MSPLEKYEVLGPWMAAALDDNAVCPEMKEDIETYFEGMRELEKAITEICEVLHNVLEIDNGGVVDVQAICSFLNKFDNEISPDDVHPEDDAMFKVICDESNNSEADIKANIMNATILIRPF